jgi:hypothetical protein
MYKNASMMGFVVENRTEGGLREAIRETNRLMMGSTYR